MVLVVWVRRLADLCHGPAGKEQHRVGRLGWLAVLRLVGLAV